MKKADKTILYDGSCDFCTVLADKVRDTSEDFALKDATKAQLPKNISRKEALTEIHLVDNKTGKIYKNIDVVIEYIAQYRIGRLIKPIATLPGIHFLLELAYKIVANNRHNILGPNSRLYWAKNVIALSFLASIFLSWRFWSDNTQFPRSPVFGFLGDIPLFNQVLPILLSILLLLVVGSKHWRTYIWATIGFFAVLSLADQTSFQPWSYQYLVLLGLIAALPFNKKNNVTIAAAARLSIAGVYIASAIFKLNPGYFSKTSSWLIDPIPFSSSFSTDTVYALAFMSFMFEGAMGIGLLFNKTRNYAVLAATGMHLFILFTLSPLGHNWNIVVWPWNFGLIVLIWVLFWNAKDRLWSDLFKHRAIAIIIIGLFFVMPLLGHFRLWDATPSFALYPGSLAKARIIYDNPEKMPPKLVENSGFVWDWSMRETNIPINPEPRVYRQVFSQLCKRDGTITMRLQHARLYTKRTAPIELVYCES